MTLSFHPGAERDIAEAMDFYSQHVGPLVASRFLIEFERVAYVLVEHPGFGIPTTKGRRASLLAGLALVVVSGAPAGRAYRRPPVIRSFLRALPDSRLSHAVG